ncbi:Bug family tripartite tricarboxylate transporter substrate binding protein [Cupriavidus campinensis]|jgi:tripartite-type tricarboxylate transporter receptor subunit TctC
MLSKSGRSTPARVATLATNILLACASACAVAFMAAPAIAQEKYPEKPVNLVVPYPAGGAVDVVGRLLGQKLAESLGRPVVVDNKPGFSGNIGAQFVARSAPDGYTVLMAALTSYSINAALLQKANGYNLAGDFTPVAIVGNLPIVLLVSHDLPANSVQDLIRLAQAKPNTLAFGSSGNGSIEHVAGEMFRRQAGLELLHVPYKGAAPAVADLLGGQIQIMFATGPTALSAIKSGKVRALAVATPQRIGALPDVPTVAEAGLKDFVVPSTYGVLVRQGTPKPIVTRLNAELQKILQMPDVKARFAAQGIDVVLGSADDADHRLKGEVAKWARVIQETRIAAQ